MSVHKKGFAQLGIVSRSRKHLFRNICSPSDPDYLTILCIFQCRSQCRSICPRGTGLCSRTIHRHIDYFRSSKSEFPEVITHDAVCLAGRLCYKRIFSVGYGNGKPWIFSCRNRHKELHILDLLESRESEGNPAGDFLLACRHLVSVDRESSLYRSIRSELKRRRTFRNTDHIKCEHAAQMFKLQNLVR